jgi:hypothetical protein
LEPSIATPTVFALAVIACVIGFCVWKINQVNGRVRSGQREREMALLATLPGAASLLAEPVATPSVDDLVLDPVEGSVRPLAGGQEVAPDGPSQSVQAVAAALMRASVQVTRAGAAGGDAAAADVVRALLADGPVAALVAAHETKA